MGENCEEKENRKRGMDATLTKVFIWDMDETLILLKSLLNGTFAQSFNGLKDADKGVQLGRMWENHILNVCDECFFYEQVSFFPHFYSNGFIFLPLFVLIFIKF